MIVNEELINEIGSVMKLEFTDTQMSIILEEINSTISMFEELENLDTEGVEGTFYGTLTNKARLRKDEAVKNEKEVSALLENAPATKDTFIEVPAILEDGEGGA